MRHPVRPFVIEFKSRSSKASAPRSPKGDEERKAAATPAFLDVSVFVAGRNTQRGDYETAMKAADAVFGRIEPAAVATEPKSSSNAPTGRVLPSLIENTDAVEVRAEEAEEKPRRNRVARQTETASPVRPNSPARSGKPTVRSERVAPQEFVKPNPIELPPDASVAVAAEPDGERRSLRKRRLLNAELKAGEKWKRRLCKAAR